MLLTITTTRQPATDLGYLLHKHPDRVQRFPLTFGAAHVFYPENGDERCTAALLLDIDPIDLIRRKRAPRGNDFSLGHYVNDRPYVASSFMSVAIAEVFTSALNGHCNTRPELVEEALPLRARLAVLPSRGGEQLIRRLFEPLGYDVTVCGHPLDEQFPEWGASDYFTVDLEGTLRLRDMLAHLYVLIPVLDNEKHYWVSDDEVEKLLRHGEGWLAAHPERELIAKRYLKHQRSLAGAAIARLAETDERTAEGEAGAGEREDAAENAIGLQAMRLANVRDVLRAHEPSRVLDLGCGNGQFIEILLAEPYISEVVGMDVSFGGLEKAAERLRLDTMPAMKRNRVRLLQGSLVYDDDRFAGFDAVVVMEVIEHLDPFRLETFERVLFGNAHPQTVVVTTPNSEYNVMWPTLPAGFRHTDHRFEWRREEFERWGNRVAGEHGYAVRFQPIGPGAEGIGSPTQMGVFTR
jgi:3' terminal RNA ribose 2'-O-methyltransferase Hen1